MPVNGRSWGFNVSETWSPAVVVHPQTGDLSPSQANTTKGLSGRHFTGKGRRQFVFIGAQPSTEWLAGQLAEDTRGFLLTGSSIPEAQLDDAGRMPLFLETSRPGVFAVGDVRSGSVKRAATAIGEGSMAARLVFERLQVEL
jgi:thioredoxin reductase (NADPH)